MLLAKAVGKRVLKKEKLREFEPTKQTQTVVSETLVVHVKYAIA